MRTPRYAIEVCCLRAAGGRGSFLRAIACALCGLRALGVGSSSHCPRQRPAESSPRRSQGMTAKTGACKAHYPPAAGITGFVQVPLNDGRALLRAVAMQGLISVSVDASNWFLYDSGVFDGCTKEIMTPNHAVTLVGYGKEGAVKYWLIQNSWSTDFGEEGYIRLRRYDEEPCGLNDQPQLNSGCEGGPPEVPVCGECAVLSDSSYPTGAFVASANHDRRLRGGFFV